VLNPHEGIAATLERLLATDRRPGEHNVVMFAEYLSAAMHRAQYEEMEDGDFWGEIPGFDGLWGSASSLNECREALFSALEDWILVGIALGHDLPEVDGVVIPTPRICEVPEVA
jgi:predicted RNase H-like HicB family nuclease